MKKVKELKKRYIIAVAGNNIGLISLSKGFSEKEKILCEVKTNFEDKLLAVASDVEEIQSKRLEEVQTFSNDIFNNIQKLNEDKLEQDFIKYCDEIKELEIRVNDRIKKMNEERDDVYEEISKKLCSSLAEECSFLNRGIDIHTRKGEMGKALELKQLIKSMLRNASEVIDSVIAQYEISMADMCNEIWRVIGEKAEKIVSYVEDTKAQASELIDDMKEVISDKVKENMPRTYNQLKRYLESSGFEIDRYNGSHEIYRNSETGEVRVLPTRRGSHMLAPKTCKKILEGNANSFMVV